MKKLKSITLIYICFLLCFSLVSCGEDYSDKSIVFASNDSVSTFDPQLCKTSSEITIATNSFEGLLTKDEKGNIVNGAAESYSVSDDKKVYTFKIRDGMMWSDGETPLTAADFEFGIKRAVMKETDSPYVSALYSIKNAEKINKGKAKSSALGVKSDSNILEITLNKADDGLLETLTRPMCFPCNEEFFESTGGKYGLSNKYIISNGAYSINYYNSDTKTVIIQNNANYKGEYKAIPKQITINYSEEYEDIYSDFKAKEIDMGVVECGYLTSLDGMGNKSKLYYNTNYCLFMSKNLRTKNGVVLNKALSLDIDRGSVEKNVTDYYNKVEGIIPSVNILDGVSYRKTVGAVKIPEYNAKKAEKLLGNFDDATEVLNGLSIYYPSGDERLSLISNLIAQGWQKDLNVYINSSEEETEAILSKIKSGEILMAIIPVSSENNSAVSSINSLNQLGIAEKAAGNTAAKLLKYEQKLIDDGVIYPILSIPTAVSYSENISGFSASSDGKIVDFRFIKMS